MSLFTDASIEAAEQATGYGLATTRDVLDAAVAALDETELIEKAAAALEMCESSAYHDGGGGEASNEELARAVLTAIGLLP